MAALTPILSTWAPDEPERVQQVQVGFTGQDLLDRQSRALLESSQVLSQRGHLLRLHRALVEASVHYEL